MLRGFLMRVYWRIEKRIHPGLRFSQDHYHETLLRRVPTSCEWWLDLGCGHQMIAAWMVQQEKQLAARSRNLVGMDRDLAAMRKNPVITSGIAGDLEALPFERDQFDVIT